MSNCLCSYLKTKDVADVRLMEAHGPPLTIARGLSSAHADREDAVDDGADELAEGDCQMLAASALCPGFGIWPKSTKSVEGFIWCLAAWLQEII